MRRRLRRRPAPWKALTSKSTKGKPRIVMIWGLTLALLLLGCPVPVWIPRGKAVFVLVPQDGVRVGCYPSSAPAGHPPHPDALRSSSLRGGERPGGT